jgi:hypothetical protein
MTEFPHALLGHEASAQVSGVSADSMQNLRGIFALNMGDTSFVHIFCAGLCLAVAAIMFVIWLRAARETGRRFDVLAGITTLIMLITSLHTHTQDYIVALLPCAWLYMIVIEAKGNVVSERTANAIKFLSIGFVTMSWFFFLGGFLFRLIKIQPFVIWAVVFTIYSAIVYLKLGSASEKGTLQE